jgi:hypothetical protein
MEIYVRFKNPQACLARLGSLFAEADADGASTRPLLSTLSPCTLGTLRRGASLSLAPFPPGSGGVDQAELAAMLSKFYREQKMARPLARVEAEVAEAMQEYDEDGNGTLEAPPHP